MALYRAYSADAGRWLSPDPIGESGGLNLYGYVLNDPVNYWDPLGLIDTAGKIAQDTLDNLKKDPEGRKTIERCEKLERETGEKIVIKGQEGLQNIDGDASSSSDSGVVNLPRNAPQYPTGENGEGRKQATLEEVLNHELSHQCSRMDGTRAKKKARPDKQFRNSLEREAIESTNRMESRWSGPRKLIQFE